MIKIKRKDNGEFHTIEKLENKVFEGYGCTIYLEPIPDGRFCSVVTQNDVIVYADIKKINNEIPFLKQCAECQQEKEIQKLAAFIQKNYSHKINGSAVDTVINMLEIPNEKCAICGNRLNLYNTARNPDGTIRLSNGKAWCWFCTQKFYEEMEE